MRRKEQPKRERQPDWHRRQTEWRLVTVGFVLIVAIGGPIMWVLWGPTIALIALGILFLAAVIFALLMLLLRAMEAWSKSE
ncbi:MAG: hypothetical protein ACYC3S_18305 [Chloroflexota bacterium]